MHFYFAGQQGNLQVHNGHMFAIGSEKLLTFAVIGNDLIIVIIAMYIDWRSDELNSDMSEDDGDPDGDLHAASSSALHSHTGTGTGT